MRDTGFAFPADLPRPRSPAAVAAIAQAVEREAERRYAVLAAELRALGSLEVASLLERLAGEHEARVARLRAEAGGDGDLASKGRAALLRRVLPEETLADCDRAGLTPYRVLAHAVQLAHRSFELYSYLAAGAENGASTSAERLAGEELARAARLRAERRRAYHAERRSPRADLYPAANTVRSLSDLLAAALAIEGDLAQRLETARQDQPGLSSAWRATERRIEDLRRTFAQRGDPYQKGLMDLPHGKRAGEDSDRAAALRSLLADCARAFAFYDAVASAPADEAVMLKAQDLSSSALDRIRQVHASDEAG